ncbi:PQ_loop repeat-containing protein [Hexamita inflata]|uniref:PQ_loop repeat-containing protein n=1 Tax=Hexamita inflata TaxID=28002 RepID=A0ABP1GHL4_9EUKA
MIQYILPLLMKRDPCCAEIGTCNTNPYDYSEHLQNYSAIIVIFGFIILILIIVSLIPMISKLCTNKSVSGISFTMLLLVCYSLLFQSVSYIMQDFSKIMACSNSFSKCFNNLIPLYHIIYQFIIFFLLMVIFMFYELQGKQSGNIKHHLLELISIIIIVVLTIPCIIVFGLQYGSCNKVYKTISLIFSIFAWISTAIGWIIQIQLTHSSKNINSLSSISILLQCLCNFITLIYIIVMKSKWQNGISIIINFIIQFVLCYIIISQQLNNKSKLKIQQQFSSSNLTTENSKQFDSKRQPSYVNSSLSKQNNSEVQQLIYTEDHQQDLTNQ